MVILSTPALGQSAYSDPYRFWKWPGGDAAALVSSLTSRSALYAAAGGGVLLLAAKHDQEVTADLSSFAPEPADLLVRVIEEFGNEHAVRPVAGVIFIGTLFTSNERLQDAAFTSLEAVVFAGLMTNGLKSAFGRARPWQEVGALTFKPFSGNTSFPSGHATTAFAFVTPWLLYYPNALTPGLLILGAGTAFSRLMTNNHWFTDVVAGSAIGFFTAYFLVQRHERNTRRLVVAPSLGLHHVGMTFSLKLE
jgi:membrane-associated phospholipid phosphatase